MATRRLAVLLALGLAIPAHANPDDHSLAKNEWLLESCQSRSATLRAMCLGYFAAVVDDLRFDHANVFNDKAICLPPLVNLEQYRSAYVDYVWDKPDLLQGRSYPTVKAAFATRWPCR